MAAKSSAAPEAPRPPPAAAAAAAALSSGAIKATISTSHRTLRQGKTTPVAPHKRAQQLLPSTNYSSDSSLTSLSDTDHDVDASIEEHMGDRTMEHTIEDMSSRLQRLLVELKKRGYNGIIEALPMRNEFIGLLSATQTSASNRMLTAAISAFLKETQRISDNDMDRLWPALVTQIDEDKQLLIMLARNFGPPRWLRFRC
ncbi:hypothetical protein CF319_g5288 [Tilletia indica]|nr:hypothetical protein CF319_g5288 [Tilletia indica]